MFGTENVKENSLLVPEVGGVENCQLTSMKLSKDKNQKTCLDFTFKNMSTGGVFTHKEFDPTDQGSLDAETHQKRIGWVMGRIKHIMGRYLPEAETIIPNVASWDAFVKVVGGKMKGRYQGITCSLKVVYNKSNFPSFPLFPDFISTEAFPKIFTFDPDYDRLIKTGGSDSATSNPSGKTEKVEDYFDEDDDIPVETEATTTETTTAAEPATETAEAEDDDIDF